MYLNRAGHSVGVTLGPNSIVLVTFILYLILIPPLMSDKLIYTGTLNIFLFILYSFTNDKAFLHIKYKLVDEI